MAVYEIITNRIIKQLDKGVIPWQRPWGNSPLPKNLVSGKEYRGVNILLLSFTEYKSPYWLTYRQAQDLKGHVKAGERGCPVVYYNMIKVDGSQDEEKLIPYLRYHTVFNVEQCEGLTVPEITRGDMNPIEECERVMENMQDKPSIKYGGDKACYIPSMDIIRMPYKESFHSIEEYYSTLFHEGVHATGEEKRLNRKSICESHAFGSETYSKEELIAEIGSSFLCAITGIENKTLENQAAYISSWLNRLKNDKKLIITAASQAQKAVDYILNRKAA